MTPENIKHAKHVIIAVLVVIMLFKIVAHLDGKAHDARVLADQSLKVQQEKNRTDADTSVKIATEQTKRESENTVVRDRTDADNKRLQSQIFDLKLQLSEQQKKDSVLPPTEQASRISTLIGGIPGDVKSVPDGILFSPSAASTTVQLLDETVTLRQTTQTQQAIIANNNMRIQSDETTLSGLHEQVGQLKERVSNLEGTIKQTNETWQKDKKDDAHKSRNRIVKALGIGAAIGAAVVKFVL